ncbi:unnamed protein product [Linum trigynum]|uniref:Uncharacterized protein n=1 Tax=Linum trigynum TaxID=586398 RepID=A0AAV2GJ92_9ROSI
MPGGDGSSHLLPSTGSGWSSGRKKTSTGTSATAVVAATPATIPINLDSSETVSDPITTAAQGMLNLDLLSPFSMSDFDWDFSGVNADFGGSWSIDDRYLLCRTRDGSFELIDVALGLGIENVANRGDASAVGDNLATFDDLSMASVSREEGFSIDEHNLPERPDSPSIELS